ncbi:MAG TPA: hypothetical protein VKA65_15950 [Acidimicrobiales bacterium]|nr:hypothetical protein [Acidimicrobiales bacterium]
MGHPAIADHGLIGVLYSEEIDRTGRQVGNVPRAFTHLALIAAVLNLDHRLDHPKGPGALELPGPMARRG